MQLFNKSNISCGAVLVSCVLVLLSSSSSAKNKIMCELNPNTEISAIANHPLFDTPYKAAANYIPVMPLRALASTELLRKKGTARMVRNFYVRNLQGKLAEPYETMTMDLEVSSRGLFGRTIKGTGRINDLDLYYENQMSFRLPKKIYMEAFARLDGCEMMKLKIETDGDKLTNDVRGLYLGKKTDYHTDWRTTTGFLAGSNYEMIAEGISKGGVPCDKHNQNTAACKEHANDKPSTLYVGKSSGKVAGQMINGWVRETRANHFEAEENYGPIVVKTIIDTVVGK